MIHVFFAAGSFGSTIEYVIRNYSNHLLGPINASIAPDGSMHSWKKQHHLKDLDTLKKFLNLNNDVDSVTTPFYPFKEFKLPVIIEHISTIPTWKNDSKILIYQADCRAAELNLLFIYHKVCNGYILKMGLDIIIGNNRENLTGWNPEYTHWSQMQIWELREWLSFLYPGLSNDFIESQYQVDDSWLKISNTDILYNTKDTLEKIISFCKLKIAQPLDPFVNQWQQAQQYVINEFNLLDEIIQNSINNIKFSWKPINIVAESIIQQRLRSLGYEIKCHGLNTFPVDSETLYKLLEKC
jgi:hypothetical protein